MTARNYSDNCPECLSGPNEPVETVLEGDSLKGSYRCPGCGHVWFCWWNVASLPDEASSAGDVA